MRRLHGGNNGASLKRRGTEEARMQLHQRGVDLLVNLMDADQHFDSITPEEIHQLIREAVVVFGQLLDRDIPDQPAERSSIDMKAKLI
jgi:hypothetical protein